MENQTKNMENQKLVFGDKYLWGESTHYLVMSRRQLAKIWKFANNKSIKEYGKKVLQQTVTMKLVENEAYTIDNRKQINIVEVK